MNFFSCTHCVFGDWCHVRRCCIKTNVNEQQNNNNIIKEQSHVITNQPVADKSDGSDFEFAQKMQYVTIFRGANEHRRLDTKITIDRN